MATATQHTQDSQNASSAAQLVQPVSLERGRAMVATLLILSFFNGFDTLLFNVGLPAVERHFSVDLYTANWLVLIFTTGGSVAVICAGRIIERLGLKRTMLLAMICLSAGSLLGVFSFSIWVMVAARLLQGISSGLIYPSVNTAIVWLAPKEKQGSILSYNTAAIGLGTAAGPLLAGLIIDKVGVNAVFAATLIMSIVGIVLCCTQLSSVITCEHVQLDIPSFLIALVGLCAFLWGLNYVSYNYLVGGLCAGGGAVLLGIFCVRQLRIKIPLLRIEDMKNHEFAEGVLLNTAGNTSVQVTVLLVPLYLEETCGFGAFAAGLTLILPELISVAITLFSGHIEDTHGTKPLAPLGFALISCGFIAMMFIGANAFVAVLLMTILVLAGCAMACAPDKALALSKLPEKHVASGSAINSTLARLAQSFASSLFAGVLGASAVAALARGSARSAAYAQGFNTAMIIAAVMALAALILAFHYAHITSAKHSEKRRCEPTKA